MCVTMPGMRRHPALVLLVPLTLVLGGCGQGEDPERLAAVSAEAAAPSLAQDLQPLHAEALELADLVAAASPSADVAAALADVRSTQQALLADVDSVLAEAARTPGETAALTLTELEAVRSAAGDEAVRLGLDGLLRNHLAAVSRAKAEVADGRSGAQGELSRRVLDDVGADLQALSALG